MGCITSSAKRRVKRFHPGDPSGSLNIKVMVFTYKELKHATDNFHQSNLIGQGGFGTVFKGILKNGTPIAAKVLSAMSKQGINELLTEIDMIAGVKHPNLVELIGCCVEGGSRILVYEFVQNRSLDHVLFGNDQVMVLDWKKRSAICVGIAAGLSFLHEELVPHIVHRDIKASNILLDGNFVPKIGDFGLAKLFPDTITHISTKVAGTNGYLAPEYAMGGKLTKKADVYSFGVLVLEIISGRSDSKILHPGSEKLLLEQTWQLYEEGRLIEMVDENLRDYPEQEALKYIKMALFCTQGAADRRPSMAQVLEMLSNPVQFDEKELTPPRLVTFREYTWTTSFSSQKKDFAFDARMHQNNACSFP